MTLVYTVGAFSIWGGGWLAAMGAADFSGGYVIHLAAGTSGFVAAALIGPRIQQDRDHFPPNSLLMAMAGAGILWLGWNGFQRRRPLLRQRRRRRGHRQHQPSDLRLAGCVDDPRLDGPRQAVGRRRDQRH